MNVEFSHCRPELYNNLHFAALKLLSPICLHDNVPNWPHYKVQIICCFCAEAKYLIFFVLNTAILCCM